MLSLQDAKNSFSAVVAAALDGRPQHVSRRGRPAVVVISAAEYARLKAAAGARKSFVEHLLNQPEGPETPRAHAEPRDVTF